MQKLIKNKVYDIVIVGGGTSGVACAYIAGKLGLKTLVVERQNSLGGSITNGLVIPAMKTAMLEKNSQFYGDFVKTMQYLNGQHTYIDGNDGWFNPQLAKIALDKMLSSVGCDVLFNSDVVNAKKSDDKVLGVEILTSGLSLYIVSRYFIDATGDANFSEILKCKKLNSENFQSLTLRFIMGGVDINAFADFIENLDSDRNVTTVDRTGEQIHLSTAYTWDSTTNWALRPIFEQAIQDGVLKPEDSAYFQVFTIPQMHNSIAFNCPRIASSLNLNPLNPYDYSLALMIGREQIFRLANFCKKYLKGFEKAYISDISNMLGIRESRRIEGEVEFCAEDIFSEKYENCEEIALITDYPIDIHSNKQNNSTLKQIEKPYKLPLSALKNKEYNNFYVIGRCLSADFSAQASLRVQKNCFSMGEAVARDIYNKLN